METTAGSVLVTKVRVEGLAGRKSPYELELNKDVNIFFGLNGSGKTSLLKIIHSALSNDATMLIGVPFTSAEVSILVDGREAKLTRSISYEDFSALSTDFIKYTQHFRRARESMPRQFLEEMQWKDSVQWKGSSAPIPHRYLPTSRLAESRDPHAHNLQESDFDEYFAESIKTLWSRHSADVFGVVGKAQENGLARILIDVVSDSSAEQSLAELDPKTAHKRVTRFLARQGSRDVLRNYSQFKTRYFADERFRSVVYDINEIEEEIERALQPRLRLESLVSQLIQGPKQLIFGSSSIRVMVNDDQAISLGQLSSGEKQLLRILIESILAGSMPIIIDEPELSMHIDWQKVLIKSIRMIDSRTQVIAATHSPDIMADIPNRNVFRL